jgi:hypothetical protein
VLVVLDADVPVTVKWVRHREHAEASAEERMPWVRDLDFLCRDAPAIVVGGTEMITRCAARAAA